MKFLKVPRYWIMFLNKIKSRTQSATKKDLNIHIYYIKISFMY